MTLMLTCAELRGEVSAPDLTQASGADLLDSYTLCVRLSYKQSAAWLEGELRRRLLLVQLDATVERPVGAVVVGSGF